MRKVIPILAAGMLGAGLMLATAEDKAAPAAGADQPRHMKGPGDMMKDADTNNDGQISLEEFLAAHEKMARARFKEMDVNGDGFLTKEERPRRPDGERPKRLHPRGGEKDGAAPGATP